MKQETPDRQYFSRGLEIFKDEFQFNAFLCEFEPRVPPKGSKRPTESRELYCLKQYLSNGICSDFLSYPLTIHGPGGNNSPDFILENGQGVRLGLEITEATDRDSQELYQKVQTSGEAHHIPEENWPTIGDALNFILERVRKKQEGLSGGQWKKADRYELLVYLNISPFYPDENQLAHLIMEVFEEDGSLSDFDRVMICSGDLMITVKLR